MRREDSSSGGNRCQSERATPGRRCKCWHRNQRRSRRIRALHTLCRHPGDIRAGCEVALRNDPAYLRGGLLFSIRTEPASKVEASMPRRSCVSGLALRDGSGRVVGNPSLIGKVRFARHPPTGRSLQHKLYTSRQTQLLGRLTPQAQRLRKPVGLRGRCRSRRTP